MGLNFDKLSGSTDFDAEPIVASGKPLDIALTDIAEDPENPRKEFDTELLKSLAADIAQNNVKSPVSIRKNPTGETPWILNFGARRYRASLLASKETIPAFVDEQFTNYDAVAENEQRQNLTAMELAIFIQSRKNLGESNSNIAIQLQKNKQAITHHLALIDMPENIAGAYRSGRLKAPKAIYDLVVLNKKYEKEVTKFCKEAEGISYSDVRKLSEHLKRPEHQPELPLGAPNDKAGPSAPQKPKASHKPSEPDSVDVARFANIPVLHVLVDGEQAVIVLEQKPSQRGMVWIRYLSNNSTAEVKADSCTLVELSNAEKLDKRDKETA